MRYRVELIPKQSVMDDILEMWKMSGRSDNTCDGQFVFESVDYCWVEYGSIIVGIEGDDGDGKKYYYNMADFYRVKVIAND